MKTKKDKIAKKQPPEEPKKFLEYKQTARFQLSLFDLLDNEKDFSHTIELYDFMPKYVWGKVERVGGVFLPRLEREFKCRGKKYRLTFFRRASKMRTVAKNTTTRLNARRSSRMLYES